MKWFTLSWYQYLLTSTSLRNLWCRIKGHPNGPVFYTDCLHFEPNACCKDCDEEII